MSSAVLIARDRQTLLRIVSDTFAGAFLLSLCLAAPITAQQNPAPATQNSAPAQQKPAPVTTTVVVHGEIEDNYLPQSVVVGTLDGAPLRETPLSATVVTRDLLNDQVSRLLSDVVKNDASVGDDYVPVGYYGDYQIRGFPLDLATGLEVNGMTIAGEQDVPLENKEQVEFLKGIAAVESGVASAGGLIDYVTKRPANIKAVDLATDHRGSAFGAVDLGHLFGSRKQVGARVNLAGERIVPYMNDTNGWRAMGAGAADWKIDPATTLKGDFEYQHKVERDGSGYQLLGGTTLPDINQIYRSTMLGDQPWGRPTPTTPSTPARASTTISRRRGSPLPPASFSHSLIQDNVIYAYGCYYETECAQNPALRAVTALFFAPDGTYDIYDYRDPGELRIDAEAEAMVTGHIHTGAITQDITAGGESSSCAACSSPASTPCRTPTSRRRGAGRRGLHLRRLREYLPAHRASFRLPELPLLSKIRSNPRARAVFGKTAIKPRLSSRTACIFPAAFSSSPPAVTIRCATTTTLLTQLRGLHRARCMRSHIHRQSRLAAAIRRHLQPRCRT